MATNQKLTTGDTFPNLHLRVSGGGELMLPADIESTYAFVLLYRGHW